MEIYREQGKRTVLPEQGWSHRASRAGKQRTDIGRYCFVNGTVKLWNQLPAEALTTVTCESRHC
jgi:hypothetical protein